MSKHPRRVPMAVLVVAAFGVIALGVPLIAGPIRSWRIRQDKPLVDGISMRVEDVLLYPTSSHTILRIKCRFLGGDPVGRLPLRASIRTDKSSAIGGEEAGQLVGIPDDGLGGIPKIWEFNVAPEGAQRFIMRVYYGPPSGSATDRYVDFAIPYLPRVTPNGEIGR